MRYQERKKVVFERRSFDEVFWVYDNEDHDHPIEFVVDEWDDQVDMRYADRCAESFNRTQ
jgi:hypothetical protein